MHDSGRRPYRRHAGKGQLPQARGQRSRERPQERRLHHRHGPYQRSRLRHGAVLHHVANNDFLNHKNETPSGYGYAVFGKVIQGQDVVDRIKSVSTGSYGPYQDVPKTPVIIKSIVPVQ
ncbi:MAG: peptidylprolyl isomerase [Bilophila wadsworthia]